MKGDAFFAKARAPAKSPARPTGNPPGKSPRVGNRRALSNPAARKSVAVTAAASKRKRPPQATKHNSITNDGDGDDDDDDGGFSDTDITRANDRSDDDDDDNDTENAHKHETPAMKRLRLAKKYIAKIAEVSDGANLQGPTEFDAQDIDNDLIAERLRDDVLDSKGKLYHKMANRLKGFPVHDPQSRIRMFAGGKKVHQLSLTCIDVTADDEAIAGAGGVFLYTGSKDGHIVKWDYYTGKKVHEFLGSRKVTKKAIKAFGEAKLKKNIGHRDQVLTVAASGGRDKTIQIWSIPDNIHLTSFTQHRDAVSALAFRRTARANHLYSASHDRSVKVWNVDDRAYVETLFGHQDRIESLAALGAERCVTAGSRDRSVRLWKIVEESQLIFRGGGGGGGGGSSNRDEDLRREVAEGLLLASEIEQAKKDARRQGAEKFGCCVDVVAYLDDEHFISGTDNGVISLWNIGKKKPVFSRVNAHGTGTRSAEEIAASTDTISPAPCHWITALASVPYSDLFASGSSDGFVRLWQVDKDKKSFQETLHVPFVGFVNALRFFEAPVRDATATTTTTTTTGSAAAGAEDADAAETPLRKAGARLGFHAGGGGARRTELCLAVALGQEHRLGRWWRVREAKNQLGVAFIETQAKHQNTARQLATVRAQMAAKERDRKIGELAARELSQYPAATTVAYKSVGKMFLQKSLADMTQSLQSRSEDAGREAKTLGRAAEKLERDLKDLERGLTELLQRRMM
ncbi:pre-rRNA processing protein [Entophlyctis luteolus]|nr:pre-rRNA processing protein [Entophlyctis luteolus]